MRLSAIVAMSENRVIGVQNRLPWHLPADLRHFKQITLGKPIIMGRKTFDSIGRPLPGRENIIITRDPHFQAQGCRVVHSIDEALAAVSHCEEVFIIGGAELFKQTMPCMQRLYLTIIHHEFAGDAFFENFDSKHWHEVEKISHAPDNDNSYAYTFITLEKIS
jgi:dihydrofolate reductase